MVDLPWATVLKQTDFLSFPSSIYQCFPSLSTLGFGLNRACTDLMHSVSTAASSISNCSVLPKRCCFPVVIHSLSSPSPAMISVPWEEGVWHSCLLQQFLILCTWPVMSFCILCHRPQIEASLRSSSGLAIVTRGFVSLFLLQCRIVLTID